MDYILPGQLISTITASETYTTFFPPRFDKDGNPTPETIHPDAAREAYVKRIQSLQKMVTFLLIPIIVLLEAPLEEFLDESLPEKEAKAIKEHFLNGEPAGRLAFAIADVLPHTGLELFGMTVMPQMLPNTSFGALRFIPIVQEVIVYIDLEMSRKAMRYETEKRAEDFFGPACKLLLRICRDMQKASTERAAAKEKGKQAEADKKSREESAKCSTERYGVSEIIVARQQKEREERAAKLQANVLESRKIEQYKDVNNTHIKECKEFEKGQDSRNGNHAIPEETDHVGAEEEEQDEGAMLALRGAADWQMGF